MSKASNILALMGLIFLASLGSSVARADDALRIVEENRKLDEKQAEVLGRLSKVDTVSAFHGRYVVIRDTYFYGPEGVDTLAQSWSGGTSAWLAAWQNVVRAATTSTALSDPGVRETIRAAVKKQQDDWQALSRLGERVATRAADGVRKTRELGVLPASLIPAYAPHIRTLNAHVARLGNSIEVAGRDFETESLEKFGRLIEPSTRAILAKLRLACVGSPELLEALAMVEEAFKAELLVEPEVRRVNEKYSALAESVLLGRIYHAEKSLAELVSEANAARARLQAAAVDPLFKQSATKEIETLLATGQKIFNNKLRTASRSEVLAPYLYRESLSLAQSCQTVESAKGVNCELLRVLLKIDLNTLSTMKESDLKTIEYLVDKIKEGPLSFTGGRTL